MMVKLRLLIMLLNKSDLGLHYMFNKHSQEHDQTAPSSLIRVCTVCKMCLSKT